MPSGLHTSKTTIFRTGSPSINSNTRSHRRKPFPQAFPLLSLPEGVRLKIYAHALTYADPIPIRLHHTTSHEPAKGARNNNTPAGQLVRQAWFFCPPLLRTAPAIAAEATPVFLAHNTFAAAVTDGDLGAVTTWMLEATPAAHRRHVRGLVLRLEPGTVFDVVALRRAVASGLAQQTAVAFARRLVLAGVAVHRVEVELPALTHLEEDAALMGVRLSGVEEIRGKWKEGMEMALAYASTEEALTVQMEGLSVDRVWDLVLMAEGKAGRRDDGDDSSLVVQF